MISKTDIKDIAKFFNNDDIVDIVEFYFVFDSIIDFFDKYKSDSLFSSIYNLLLDFDKFQFNLSYNDCQILHKIAKSDRSKFGVNKILPRFKAQRLLHQLIDKQILNIEKTHQAKPKRLNKNQKLPKKIRRIPIYDKIYFTNNFSRFYFRFIYPNINLLLQKRFDDVLNMIIKDFESYCGFAYEKLCAQILEKAMNMPKNSVFSIWSNEVEIDIFTDFNSEIYVGEVKFKDRKTCKNILNILEKKVSLLNIKPKFYILFSKNGFSKELLNISREDVLLFDINDCKILF